MRWIPDNTGRFPQRPFYETDELNALCERTVSLFLQARYGACRYPLTTDELTVLVEQHVSDLDLYADLSSEGNDVEGVTDFLVEGKPRIRISQNLHESYRENRFRSTLTHELGHVLLHDSLWPRYQPRLFEQDDRLDHKPSPRCKRETILGANQVDWLEWQAGFASGALLMPITPLTAIVRSVYAEADRIAPVAVSSSVGQKLLHQVQTTFQVSADAARVRLLQLSHLTEYPIPPLLR
jgi:Zn-dependent peptidase ImmA (M78 family)